MDKTEKREKIKKCIKILSEEMSKENYENLLKDFKEIYDGGFRHFYSDISILLLNSDVSCSLQNFNNNMGKNTECINLDLLAENMRNFYEYAEEEKFEYIKNLDKLNDHVTMDIARINYWKKLNENYSNSLKTLNDQLQKSKGELESKTKQAISASEGVKNNLKNIYTGFLSIIGVFLSIFTLISVNINFFGHFNKENNSIIDSILLFILVNAITIISLITLVGLIYIIICLFNDKEIKYKWLLSYFGPILLLILYHSIVA